MKKSIGISILLIVIGLFFLLENLNYIHISVVEIIRTYWPIILIWMGIEKFSPVDNFNYSMSHTFTFMPRNFNGLAANFDLGNDFMLGAGVMNPVDITDSNFYNS